MTLARRLAVTMVALVVLTAAVVGWLTYRTVASAMAPAELARFENHTATLAGFLDTQILEMRQDVLGLASASALEGIVRSRTAGGVDPQGNIGEDIWRERLARHFAAEMAANPVYQQCRLVGVAQTAAHEIVRVDRVRQDHTITIAPDAELHEIRDLTEIAATMQLRPGNVHVSQPLLDRTVGGEAGPGAPVIRVSTPVFAADGSPFGLVVIHLDLEMLFARMPGRATTSTAVYVINERGEFLLHPEPSHRFAIDLGHARDLASEFPQLAGLVGSDERRSLRRRLPEGTSVVDAFVPVRPAGGAWIAVIESAPATEVFRSGGAIHRSALLGAGIGAALAALAAAVLARSLARPITKMTDAVEAYSHGTAIRMPDDVPGEFGRLARAFEEMSRKVREQTAALRVEIEERRRAEIAAENHAARAGQLSAIVESSEDAIAAVDPGGFITSWNRAAEDLFGYRAKEAIGRNIDMLVPADQRRVAGSILARVANGERVHHHETIRLRKDGSEVHVSVTVSPVRSRTGAITGASKIYRDMTEKRKWADRLGSIQKLEAIGTLAGGIAHDFNNILTAIMGNIGLIGLDLPANSPSREHVEEIKLATKRASDLTRRILTFSRQEAGQREPIDLEPVVGEAMRLLRASLPATIVFNVDLGRALPAVLADATQIHQVVMNLGTNASHAMADTGELRVRLAAIEVDDDLAETNPELHPGRYVCLEVSDSGTGMDTATLSRIFEPFFTTKEAGSGTGLGLSVVHGIMQAHEGAITVYSAPGTGTTFHLYFPAVDDVVADARAPVAKVARGNGEHVLFVDDEPSLVRVGTRLLEKLGYRVTGFSHPEDALNAFLETPARFDVVVSDMTMPLLPGPDLATRILAGRPDIPVIMITGYVRPGDMERTRALGIRELLHKPVSTDGLGAALRRALGG